MRTNKPVQDARTKAENRILFRVCCALCLMLGVPLMILGFNHYDTVVNAVGICEDGCPQVDHPIPGCACNCLGVCADYESRSIVQSQVINVYYSVVGCFGVAVTIAGMACGVASCLDYF